MDEGTTRGRTNESRAFTECTNWKPVIAAVHGYCLGHAFGTALYCDHLVAARDAQFELTEIRLGLPTAAFLHRLGHHAFAREVAMKGRRFPPGVWHAGIVTRRLRGRRRRRRGARPADPQNPSGRFARTCGFGARSAEEAARYHALPEGFDWATDHAARDAVAKLAAGGAHDS
jgi:enoyl-CoA hydratase/carnithine racemase